ncbi:hypothetical protein EDB89DRAFT_1908911 [Lactarius sanguifluus]|nr:hypothetical protein EDB89DRAFT_1908911 [Lactarius sanguifluus]
MNSDVAGRGGDGVGGAEAALAAAVSTGGLFAGPKGWRWRWLWWWQCRGGSDKGCGCGGNGDDWEPTSPGASTGVGGGCGGNGGDLYAHKGRWGQQRRQLEIKRELGERQGLVAAAAAVMVTGVTWSWRAPRDGVEATVGAMGLVHMGWSRGGSDEGWCHRQRDITRVRMRGGRMTAGGWLVCVYDACEGDCNTRSIVQHISYFHKSRNTSNGCNTTRMSTTTVVTATSPRAHTGHIPSLLPPTPVAATAASTPRQFPVHPPSHALRGTHKPPPSPSALCAKDKFFSFPFSSQADVNVAPASPRARKATPSLQPPLPLPVPIGAPLTPQLPHRFLTHGQDAADDALGRCPVHQDTMLSFPHRSLQHRAGKTPPSLIRRDDTMARDDMSRCDNLTTCKNHTGYEHRSPRCAKPRIDVRRAGGHDINTAPQPYGTAVRLRHRLGPATLQRQWDVARTRHLPQRLRHQQHNGIVARPRHRRSLQALPRHYGANTAARKPRHVPTTPTAARQAGVR